MTCIHGECSYRRRRRRRRRRGRRGWGGVGGGGGGAGDPGFGRVLVLNASAHADARRR